MGGLYERAHIIRYLLRELTPATVARIRAIRRRVCLTAALIGAAANLLPAAVENALGYWLGTDGVGDIYLRCGRADWSPGADAGFGATLQRGCYCKAADGCAAAWDCGAAAGGAARSGCAGSEWGQRLWFWALLAPAIVASVLAEVFGLGWAAITAACRLAAEYELLSTSSHLIFSYYVEVCMESCMREAI
jgi:hypothetical protein